MSKAPAHPAAVERMISRQLIGRGIHDTRVLEAMRQVPREHFMPPELAASAYEDHASPIGHGQTISQPYIVALMSEALDAQASHRVLEIGTGSGYQTAILAELAGEVFSIERVKPLLDAAWEKIHELGIRNVQFRHGDGTAGWPEKAPFDRILAAAAAPKLPEELLMGQLVDGGVAVLPVGQENEQVLLRIVRNGDQLNTEPLCGCRFVKLIGREGWEVVE